MKVSVKFHSKFHKVIKYRYYTYILTVIMIYGNLAKKSEWVVSHEHKNIIQYYRVRPAWHLHIARTQYSRTLYNSIFFFGSSKETTFMTISWDVAEKFIFKIYNIGNIFLYTLSNGIEFLEEISLSDIRWLKFQWNFMKFQWNFTINFTRLWNFLPLLGSATGHSFEIVHWPKP